ncbi:MAG: 3-keto-disaccharide hydrolase [Planctomycetota bacterium]|jgi:hypothetical protein
MNTNRFLLTTLLLAAVCHVNAGEDPRWQNLFDGKTLNGFKQLGGKANYVVEDGAIVGSSVPKTPNSFLCTKKVYGDFVLKLELNVDVGLNSGIQIRSQSLGQYRNNRVHGYQVEIDPSARAYSGGIYDEARRGWLNDLKENEPARKAFKLGLWNHYRIEAIGDSLKTWVNNVPAADMVDSKDLTGFIGLQVHSVKSKDPLNVRWRNLSIIDLGSHTWKPIFDGRTFNGWHIMPGGQWKIEDGVIIGTSSKDEKRHGMLITDERFNDVTVRLKYKSIKGNSGLYFRVDKVDSPVTVNGFQAEIDPANDAGGLYETGGRGWVIRPKPDEVKKIFKPQQWNSMTVSAHGKRIVVHVNGYKTAELKDDPGRTEGHLGLQMHGGQDMHVMFKDIEILQKRGENEPAPLPLLFETDFEDGNLDKFKATDPEAWKIEDGRGGKVLSLIVQSKYKPPVRSPLNINWIDQEVNGSFVLDLKVHSTTKEYPHRDMCLFFGRQDPSHFYYVHLGSRADRSANTIHIVDGKDRVSIVETRTDGTKWSESWHRVRLARDAESGKIEVFFDDMAKPIMTAVNHRFKSGKVGIGTFDDLGRYDDIRLCGAPK